MTERKESPVQKRLYLLLVLLAVLLISGSAANFVKDLHRQKSATENELRGIEYSRKVQAVMFSLQKIRGLHEALLYRDAGIEQRLSGVRAQFIKDFSDIIADNKGREIGVHSTLLDMQRRILAYIDELGKKRAPDSFERFTKHIDRIHDLLLETADHSDLSLDADIEVFHLSNLLINHLPSIVEAIGKLRGLGSGIVARAEYKSEDLYLLAQRISVIDAELSHLKRNLRMVFSRSGELESRLAPKLDDVEAKVNLFLDTTRAMIREGGTDLDALGFFDLGTWTINICVTLSTGVRNHLAGVLRERLGTLWFRISIVSFALGTALFLVIVLATLFYLREQNLVRQLMKETVFSSSLVDNLPSLFYLIDTDGRFRRWNHEFERISGYNGEEIARLRATELVSEAESQLVHEIIAGTIRDGSATVEFNLLTKHGNIIPLYATGFLIKLDDEPHIVGFAIDISERKALEEKLQRMALTDTLTEAYNRARFDSDLEQALDGKRRYHHNFSIILIDIDHFKRINDTFGHGTGDEVIKSLVLAIQEQVRKLDSLYRYGGEEFIVLLQEADLTGAALQAERLRNVVEKTDFGEVGKVTISLGVAESRHGESARELFKRVDDALYAAKLRGRNQTVTAD